jgi:hypothetical protein
MKVKVVSTTSIIKKMLLPTLLLCSIVIAQESTSWRQHDEHSWNVLLIRGVQYMSGTVETFFRAFCFGYGVHVLYLLYLNPNATFETLKGRMNVSFMAGLAFGCVVYGGSMVRFVLWEVG